MSENLPHLLSSFIGRQTELAVVKGLLAGHRLVTLTGPGGVGKTRLAIAAAAEVSGRHPDGIFLVELASLAETSLIAQTIATTVGLREQSGQEWLDTLTEWLRPKQSLLLLDNCEHLLETCSYLVHALLRACPQLHILTTSRENLGLTGEVVWPVPPLSLPEPDSSPANLMAYDAIHLFTTRATAVTPTFTLNPKNTTHLIRLCRQLDGLPLAIELAAARTPFLSLAQIVTRLETSLDLLAAKDPTLSPRQKTLTATIDWSYNALSDDEATLLRYLSVFAGGFTLSAIEAVISRSLITSQLEPLAQLINKSLVVVASREPEPTYRLLETVRHYAWEKLVAMGEATTVQQQHAAYYLQLAQIAEPHLRSRDRVYWQAKLEAEYDNILTTLAWFAHQQAVIAGGEMVWSLSWFFYFRGTASECRRQARIFLDMPDMPDQTAVRARLYWCISSNYWIYGNSKKAYESAVMGRVLAEKAEDNLALAYSLTLQGLTGTLSLQGENNLELHHQAIRLFQNLDDRWGEAIALYWLGECLRLRHDPATAMPYFEQSRVLFQQVGDEWGNSLPLQGAGAATYQQGNYVLARSQLEDALRLRRACQDNWLIAQTLNTLAAVLEAQGERRLAIAHFLEAATLYQEIGDDYGRLYTLFKLGELAQQSGDAPAARTYFQDCLTLAEAFEHPRRIAECRSALAQLTIGPITTAVQPTLYITAFGPGEVHRDNGHLINSSEWSYARVTEMFFYLLDNGPRTKAQIGLDFWPDGSPARLRRNLHDTLYQLRLTLGRPDWVVYENGRYTINPALPYQYDVAIFIHHLQSPTIDGLQQAIALYRADFLTEFDGDWCLLRRENLRQQFLRALLQLGELLVKDGRYPQAAGIYRQAIAHDNLQETAHRELMRCLAKMGEPTQAIRHYHSLTNLLQAELNVTPSPETITLYHQLQQGKPL